MQAPGSNLSTKVSGREQKTNTLLALLTSKPRVKLKFAMLFFSRCQMLKSGLLLYLNEASLQSNCSCLESFHKDFLTE